MEWVDRVPWNRYRDAEDADGDVPEAALVGGSGEVSGEVGSGESKVVFVDTRERAPREFYIKKSDAERHGYTRGCEGV